MSKQKQNHLEIVSDFKDNINKNIRYNHGMLQLLDMFIEQEIEFQDYTHKFKVCRKTKRMFEIEDKSKDIEIVIEIFSDRVEIDYIVKENDPIDDKYEQYGLLKGYNKILEDPLNPKTQD